MGTALVTGASAGLGAEFARQLAEQGIKLLLVARRKEKLHELAAQLRENYNVAVEVLAADLSDPTMPAKIFAATQKHGLQIDYLINNAGAAGPDLLANSDWPAQRKYTELMMTSVAAMCHFFIPPMRERGFGRVINVASVAGRIQMGGDNSYGPAKAYLVALSEAMNATVREDGVNVLALCPGFTHTDFHETDKLRKLKRSLPKFIWYNADVVVREGLKALEKGKPVYVSGRLYRWADPLFRMGWIRRLLARSSASKMSISRE